MVKLFVPLLLLLMIVTSSYDADARRRRRRRRRKKKIPMFTITGRVSVSVDRGKVKPYFKILRKLKRFKRKAYWRIYDPLIVIPRRIPLSERMVAVVYGIKTAKAKNTDAKEIRVKGMSIFPSLTVINKDRELSVYNAYKKRISIYSPGRKIGKKLLKPESISSSSDNIFNVGPRESETSDENINFWSYPLRLKKFETAKARVVFVRSQHYAVVEDYGVYTISMIPPGKYKLAFIYVDKIVKEVDLVIPKKYKRRSKILYKNFKLSVPVLKPTF
jgi:hypothetical protein